MGDGGGQQGRGRQQVERPQVKLEKKTFRLPRGVSRPFGHHLPFSFLFSPCLATSHIRSSLISAPVFIHLHPPAAFDVLYPIYTTQIVQLPLSALRTASLGQPPVDTPTSWPLNPRSPWSKVFRLLQSLLSLSLTRYPRRWRMDGRKWKKWTVR